MKDYSVLHNNLPVLQNGYTYFKLRELVDNLQTKDDTFACYVDMLENEIHEIRYIRTTNLSCDYRNCDIDILSITSAPYWTRCYNASLNKFVEHLEVYDTDNDNGGYAAFVDGLIKVGKISAAHKTIPISTTIAHFAAKPDGAARTEFILRELTSEYVREQASRIYQAYHEVSRFDLYEFWIAVPSIEVQDEFLKSEALISGQMKGVYDTINTYFCDESSKQYCINNLREVIGAATSGLGIDTKISFNNLRIILEYFFRAANRMGFLHDNCIPARINLWDSFYFMSGGKANHCGYVWCQKIHFPAPIKESVRFIMDVTNPGSHADKPTPDDMKLQEYLQYMDTPYLLYSTAYLLCEVIIWFGKYSKEYPNKEENRKLWRQ